MGWEIAVIFLLLVVALVLFATEWAPIDFTALLVLVVLLLTGILTPAEGLSGLSNPATVAIAAMFVVSEGIRRTGGLRPLVKLFSEIGGGRDKLAMACMMLIIGTVSAFINNTAAVAIFIPVMIAVANRSGRSPSKLLMPLSFASMFGGVCTLIGTSTNILVSSIAEENGQEAFGMFEFAPMGVVFFVAGFAYMFLVGNRLVPARRATQDEGGDGQVTEYVTDVTFEAGFKHLGKRLEDADFLSDYELAILEMFDDDGESIADPQRAVLRADQTLRLRGSPTEIQKLVDREDVQLATTPGSRDIDLEKGQLTVVEAVVSPDGGLTGRRVGDVDVYDRFGATLLAIRHHGELRQRDLNSIRLAGGDVLLLLMPRRQRSTLQGDRAFVLATETGVTRYRTKRLPIALLVLLAVVLGTAVGAAPLAVCAVSGAVALVLSGCLTNEEAYKAVDWKVIFLLAGIIPLGVAMQKTGAAELIAGQVDTLIGHWGPTAVLSGYFVVTMLMTAIISNQATAALLAPVAIQSANSMNVDPRPMLMAVTFAASLSFITPVGYQTNTLIYGSGQYRFFDFTKVGLPLNVLFWILATLLIPVIWPF